MNRASALCSATTETLYNNLEELYLTFHYPPSHIWNCDKSGVQAGRSGGATVLAKRGSRSVHSIEPDQREHLSVLSCINADGGSIPNFYILKGTFFLEDYIARCEDGAVMGMQPNAWMTKWLFESWISHFITCLRNEPGVDLTNRHLLILDGHNSHVTLEVVRTAMESGVDIISLPSHTSHALQPLNIAYFRPFKCAFRKQRDAWTVLNKNKKVGKQDLCEWTSKALETALTAKNIKSGFRKIGIWPLDHVAAIGAMMPSAGFAREEGGSGDASNSPIAGSGTLAGSTVIPGQGGAYPVDHEGMNMHTLADINMCQLTTAWQPEQGRSEQGAATQQMLRSRAPSHCDGSSADAPPFGEACASSADGAAAGDGGASNSDDHDACTLSSPSQAIGGAGPSDHTSPSRLTHFFVDLQHAEDSIYEIEERHVPIDPTFHAHLQDHQEDNISNFLALLEVIPAMKRKRAQPLLDFSKSKILTSLAYTEACEQLLAQKSAHEAEAKRKAAEREATRDSRLKAKEERQLQVQERAQAREVKRRERERLQAEKLAEKLATSGGRRRRTTEGSIATKGSVANGVAPAEVQLPQHAGATTPNMRFPSP